jgi:hypothetical protein
VFRVSFFGCIGEIVLVVRQELIELLSGIDSVNAKCSWTSRRKLVEHVDELVAIKFKI